MFNELIKKITDIDKSVVNLIKKGMKYSLFLCLFGAYILSINEIGYEVGLFVFRTGLIFSVQFVVCGFLIDTIKKREL